MLFISLLALTTFAIAGAAAYFSVYGLAYTFSGVFWSVVAMGASLEAGKLMAASYLYRYWTQTNIILKSYLIVGILALMALTSVGIFGYLSVGYQQDVLPLKQKAEQITLLEDERKRSIARKQEIDTLMAQGPSVNNVNRGNGNIDPAAARTIRAATAARAAVVKQYQDEQRLVTQRIKELDAELLVLKQEVIKTEAKVGPIAYIARSFNLESDDATKYLIFIIIFAFDPMAVALTLAFNTALRLRREEQRMQTQEVLYAESQPTPPSPPEPMQQPFVTNLPTDTQEHNISEPKTPSGVEPVPPELLTGQPSAAENQPPLSQEVVAELPPQDTPVVEAPQEHTIAEHPAVEEQPVVEEVIAPQEEVTRPPAPATSPTGARIRPYPSQWENDSPDKIRELVAHHKYLSAKRDRGETLSNAEKWELDTIQALLQRHGVSLYLTR